jgi:hypothetical protein
MYVPYGFVFAQLRIAAGSCDMAITVLRVFLIQTED